MKNIHTACILVIILLIIAVISKFRLSEAKTVANFDMNHIIKIKSLNFIANTSFIGLALSVIWLVMELSDLFKRYNI